MIRGICEALLLASASIGALACLDVPMGRDGTEYSCRVTDDSGDVATHTVRTCGHTATDAIDRTAVDEGLRDMPQFLITCTLVVPIRDCELP